MELGAVRRGRPREPHDRKVTRAGYVRVRTPDGGWDYEHRVVLGRAIGRTLEKGERVRWVNGDRSDNRPENLELEGSCPFCGAALGLSQRMQEISGGLSSRRRKKRFRRPERLGQLRMWRGAP